MFIVALNDYNKIESYSDNENRLDIAKSLFKTIIDYPWFQNCGIILFLNKKDILEEQIMHTNLVDYFPEFKGPKKNAREATAFITKMFVEINTDPDRIIYSYSVCLLDPENIRSVLGSAIKDMIIHQNLNNKISKCCCF
ncbi:guanine nucleotide-binding protein G(q) subunit alpha-like [Mytilus galloprovincialis]|uniref:guanine nucleotide-binding protein G(q) subunit alpha-like n=1 Tax=Mytilus galloprovincialis TaxID=29158 RepID=UPI003F7BA032